MSGSAVAPGSVRIFDTTLRDGEQAPGAGLTAAEKLDVARQLARLNVDVIEAGFPAASPGDFEAVRRIAQETKGGIAVAAALALPRRRPAAGGRAISVAERPHLHVFIATERHPLKHKLRISRGRPPRGRPLGPLRTGGARLRRGIEFSAEDASRTDTASSSGLRRRRRAGASTSTSRTPSAARPGRVRTARRPVVTRRARRDDQRPLSQRASGSRRRHSPPSGGRPGRVTISGLGGAPAMPPRRRS